MSELGYKRVSTFEQSTERQLDGVELDKLFEDKCSGGTKNRPALNQMLDYMREQDTVHVHSIDRLARNLQDLLDLVEYFRSKGVTLRFHRESMTFAPDSKDKMQELMLSVMGAVAQFERALLLERQREGIEKAKQRGVYNKPRQKKVDTTVVLQLLAEGETHGAIARKLDCSTKTVQRIRNSSPGKPE